MWSLFTQGMMVDDQHILKEMQGIHQGIHGIREDIPLFQQDQNVVIVIKGDMLWQTAGTSRALTKGLRSQQ